MAKGVRAGCPIAGRTGTVALAHRGRVVIPTADVALAVLANHAVGRYDRRRTVVLDRSDVGTYRAGRAIDR